MKENKFDCAVRVRIPQPVRHGLNRLNRRFYKKDSEVIRDLLIPYLIQHGIDPETGEWLPAAAGATPARPAPGHSK